jgi:hypothetical protein
MRSGGVVALARDRSSAVAGRVVAELSADEELTAVPAFSMSTWKRRRGFGFKISSMQCLLDLRDPPDVARHLQLGRIARHPSALTQAALKLPSPTLGHYRILLLTVPSIHLCKPSLMQKYSQDSCISHVDAITHSVPR